MKRLIFALACFVSVASTPTGYGQSNLLDVPGQQAPSKEIKRYQAQLESLHEQEQLHALTQLKELGVAAREALPFLSTFISSPHCRSRLVKDVATDTISSIQKLIVTAQPTPDQIFPPGVRKPALYLYPKSETDVSVRIIHRGPITAAWPPLQSGNIWKVKARPDGELTDDTGRKYRYLFWEGDWAVRPYFDRNSGFVVSGTDVRDFLVDSLDMLGLNHDEANDFITYWYPILSRHAFVYKPSLIHF